MKSKWIDSAREIQRLRRRLEEAEATLAAIRSGEVDAVVVSGPTGKQVFTLQGADHTYRQLVEEMQEGALTISVDGVILYANKFLEKLLKCPLNLIIGAEFRKFLPEEYAAPFEAMLRRSSLSNSAGEIRIKSSEDALTPVYLSISTLEMESAKVFCVALTDLTDQKKHEKILTEELLSRSIIDQTLDILVVCDENQKIIRASRAAGEYAGRGILGESFDEIFCLSEESTTPVIPGTSTDQRFSLSAVIAGKKYQSYELRRKMDDAGDDYFLLSASPLQDQQGRIMGCVVSLKNITMIKEFEQNLFHLNQLLDSFRSVNRLIAHETDRSRLIREACELLTQKRGYNHALIVLSDRDREITDVAAAGLDIDRSALVCKARSLDRLRSLLDREPGWEARLSERGCERCELFDLSGVSKAKIGALCGPLEFRDKGYGLLCVGVDRRYVRDDRELTLFGEIRRDLGMAIYHIELREKELEARKEIERSLEEKNVLLKEIHHRVKNNMQVIRSLMNLQAAGLEDQELKQPFQEARNRISAMAMIHEILYKSETFSRLDLKAYIERLTEEISHMYDAPGSRISFTIDADRIILSLDQSVPCGLVLNELITNAFKHAFPDQRSGEIKIRAALTEDNQLQVVVSDNGSGLPRDIDILNTKTLGMKLVRRLVETQLGGSVNVDGADGARFNIEFPLNHED